MLTHKGIPLRSIAWQRAAIHRKVVAPLACSAHDDHITPEMIEKKRTMLKTQFYSVQRPMTLDELNMILRPLFKDVNLEITVVNTKVIILIKNVVNRKNLDSDTAIAVLDVINDWNAHDDFRRFLIKSLTSANKHNIYRYKDVMTWKCPLNIEYVFFQNDGDEDDDQNAMYI